MEESGEWILTWYSNGEKVSGDYDRYKKDCEKRRVRPIRLADFQNKKWIALRQK